LLQRLISSFTGDSWASWWHHVAVVWAVSHFHAYLYGHDAEVRTDHSAVKAVLGTPSPSGKHARWWTKVYSSGVGKVTITHRAGRENSSADPLSRNPHSSSPSEGIAGEMQIAVVRNRSTAESANTDITDMLSQEPQDDRVTDFASEQHKDPEVVKFCGGWYSTTRCLTSKEASTSR